MDYIWDLFQGKHMFYGNDPYKKMYTTRAHLAEVIGMLGPPPLDMLRRGERSSEFFTENGASPFPSECISQVESDNLQGNGSMTRRYRYRIKQPRSFRRVPRKKE